MYIDLQLDLTLRLLVWEKAGRAEGYDSTVYRRDRFGNAIQYDKFNCEKEPYAWTFSLILPERSGGRAIIDNIEPLSFEEIRKRKGIYPWRPYHFFNVYPWRSCY